MVVVVVLLLLLLLPVVTHARAGVLHSQCMLGVQCPNTRACFPMPAALMPCPARQADCYRYLEGMEALLDRLAAGGTRMHAFSNYPAWWACGCIALGVAYIN